MAKINDFPDGDGQHTVTLLFKCTEMVIIMISDARFGVCAWVFGQKFCFERLYNAYTLTKFDLKTTFKGFNVQNSSIHSREKDRS